MRKVWIYLHDKRPEATKAAISAAKKGERPPTYAAFIAANKSSPYTQRGEQHSAAKIWHIRHIETGEEYTFTNLVEFLRTHADIFGTDTDENVSRVAHGFYTIKRNVKRGASCITYKGWQIVDFDDEPNYEKRRKSHE